MDFRDASRRALRGLTGIVVVSWALGLPSAVAGDGAPVAPPTPAADGPVPIPLDQAVAAGSLVVEGKSPVGCWQVELILSSRSKEPLTLDLAGRHLVPTKRGCQRLGLSHPVTPSERPAGRAPGVFDITLAPGETRGVVMTSCCMDSGKPGPQADEVFTLSPVAPPPAVETALRWWVDHPAAPAWFVNTAIWQLDPRLLDGAWVRTKEGGRPRAAPPKGDVVRSYGGVVYFLDRGTLTSVDRDGDRRILGTGIYQVFPAAHSVFGVGLSATGRAVWQFAPTGDPPWARLFEVGDDPLLDFWSVDGGEYVYRTKEGIFHRTSRAAEPKRIFAAEDALDLTLGAVDAASGRFVVAVHEKGAEKPGQASAANVLPKSPKYTLYDLDGKTGRSEPKKTFWNLRTVGAGRGGVFCVTLAGQVERIDGDRREKLPSLKRIARILSVGVGRLLVACEDGTVGAYDGEWGGVTPIRELANESSAPGLTEPLNLSIDPLTDDALWSVGGVGKCLYRYADEPRLAGDDPYHSHASWPLPVPR